MKGVILAGGTGTRLYPLTKVTNKHLLPVGKEPMILNPVRQLLLAEIQDILVITSKDHMGAVVQLLGSGVEYNCRFTFKVQDTAGGIADALLLAEDFVRDEKMVVILGDNILTSSISPYVTKFANQREGAMVLLKAVGDPERYGIAALDEHKKMILCIEEKPTQPKSCFAVIGVYLYHSDVFQIIRMAEPSKRGELEISSVNDWYVQMGLMKYEYYSGEWTDAGTFESLVYANELMLARNNQIC
jgi:glucose-1-phosphate thymidylyltransferase